MWGANPTRIHPAVTKYIGLEKRFAAVHWLGKLKNKTSSFFVFGLCLKTLAANFESQICACAKVENFQRSVLKITTWYFTFKKFIRPKCFVPDPKATNSSFTTRFLGWCITGHFRNAPGTLTGGQAVHCENLQSLAGYSPARLFC